jgi:hypothetical protein
VADNVHEPVAPDKVIAHSVESDSLTVTVPAGVGPANLGETLTERLWAPSSP